ncbi:MAG: TatD family hydrolase [Bacteroidales bacterium]
MNWIDSHTHIYLPEFEGDINVVIRQAKLAGVNVMLLPNIDRASSESMMQLCGKYPAECKPMMALHPGSVNGSFRDELGFMAEQLKSGDFCAIGETGIDLYWDTSFRDQQVESFEQHIQWAVDYNLPLVIHSRNSFELIMEIFRGWKGKLPTGVFHCFTGNRDQAAAALDLGFYLGIGGILTYKNSGLDQVVKYTGLGPLLLETDAPYLPPVPHRGRRNEPAHLVITAQKLADLVALPLPTVAEVTCNNTKKLFALDS